MKTADQDLHPVLRWLNRDGPAVAKRYVRRCGLPDEAAADVIQDALLRAWRLVERAETTEEFVPPAIGTRLIQRAAVDLFRATNRRFPLLLADEDGEVDDEADIDVARLEMGAASPADLPVIRADSEDRIRTAAFAAATKPDDAATALGVLTLTLHPEPNLPEIPRPKAGAAPAVARGWVALHFAGRRDCFPSSSHGGADAAVTKRRERAITAAYALLRRAVSTTTPEDER